MANPITPWALVTALKQEGVSVVEVGNWRTHNRNHKGPWGPVYGVMIHHTVTSGSTPTINTLRHGYSSLPGPLSHTGITKDGKVHLIGHGRTNHAGKGDPDVLSAVIAERDLPVDNEATIDGNRHFYGFECENLGNGRDPWPWVQYQSMVKATAALCRHHGWNEKSALGHLEWQPGKIDPYGPLAESDGPLITMDRFRKDLRACLALPAGKWSIVNREESMVLAEDDLRAIARAVLETDGILNVSWGSKTNQEWKLESVLNHIGEVTRENRGRLKALQAEVTAMRATMDKLVELIAAGGHMDSPDGVAGEVRRAVAEELQKLDLRIEIAE